MTTQHKQGLKVGIVGATGMVGKVFLQLLEERKFPVSELRPFASEQSKGLSLRLFNKDYPVQVLGPQCFAGLDLVFFSSGDDISKEYAPQAVAQGAWVVDNSAAFRMAELTPLVVPEVNGDLLKDCKSPQIIANPNCSTIQLVVALKNLHPHGIEEVFVSSYQAVSGAGLPAYQELLEQTRNFEANPDPKSKNFTHPIAYNCIPQIGSFVDGFTSEEMKIMKETKKILSDSSIRVSAFTVRVPVLNGHAEAVWVRFKSEITQEQILKAWGATPGLVLMDDPQNSFYPTQKIASGKDPVFVGRLHRDLHDPKMWIFWVVADNIRKGAALNGIQIAEKIYNLNA